MLVLKQGGSQKWLCNNGNQDASGKGSAVIGQQRNQSPRLVMQSFRIKVFSRLIHATQRLLQPRAFRGTDNMMRRASRPKAQDRQAIKENVQSLYGSSWDTVYERPPDNEMEPSKPNAISRAEYVSMEAIKAFMIDRCSTPPACLGDESDGLILLDNGSHRTRISLAEDLIRHVCYYILYLLILFSLSMHLRSKKLNVRGLPMIQTGLSLTLATFLFTSCHQKLDHSTM